jgi:hypothetical protein
MHWTTLLLSTVASAAILETRQSGTPFAGFDELKPQIRSTARRTITKFGRMLCFILAKDIIPNFYSIYYSSLSRELFYLLIGRRLIRVLQGQGKGKGFGDSTSWGSAFFGSISKGLCNNNGKDERQDCTLFAGRVGVMWADGTGRIADPSTGKMI